MAKINRYDGNYKAFGINATGSERYVFGSDTNQSDALDDNINADYQRGWGIQGVGAKPPKQWFTGAMFAMSQTLSYLHQMGIAEWNTNQEYYIGANATESGVTYRSQTDNNTGNQPSIDDGTNWKIVSDLDTGKNLSSVGYYNFPGGIQIRFGYVQDASHLDTITYDEPFSNNTLGVVFGDYNSSGTAVGAHIISYFNPDKDGFDVSIVLHDGTYINPSTFFYLAVGY